MTRRTTKVTYWRDPKKAPRRRDMFIDPATYGMIDAGLDVDVVFDEGTLYLNGPGINYEIEGVHWFVAEPKDVER
jgi:hypothetical protein